MSIRCSRWCDALVLLVFLVYRRDCNKPCSVKEEHARQKGGFLGSGVSFSKRWHHTPAGDAKYMSSSDDNQPQPKSNLTRMMMTLTTTRGTVYIFVK